MLLQASDVGVTPNYVGSVSPAQLLNAGTWVCANQAKRVDRMGKEPGQYDQAGVSCMRRLLKEVSPAYDGRVDFLRPIELGRP